MESEVLDYKEKKEDIEWIQLEGKVPTSKMIEIELGGGLAGKNTGRESLDDPSSVLRTRILKKAMCCGLCVIPAFAQQDSRWRQYTPPGSGGPACLLCDRTAEMRDYASARWKPSENRSPGELLHPFLKGHPRARCPAQLSSSLIQSLGIFPECSFPLSLPELLIGSNS